MRSRWLSTFTLIGAVLVALGAVALILQHGGHPFVFDPGQPPPDSGPDMTPWYYIAIGAMMIVNGLINPVVLPGDHEHVGHSKASSKAPASAEVPSEPTDTQ